MSTMKTPKMITKARTILCAKAMAKSIGGYQRMVPARGADPIEFKSRRKYTNTTLGDYAYSFVEFITEDGLRGTVSVACQLPFVVGKRRNTGSIRDEFIPVVCVVGDR